MMLQFMQPICIGQLVANDGNVFTTWTSYVPRTRPARPVAISAKDIRRDKTPPTHRLNILWAINAYIFELVETIFAGAGVPN